MKVAAHPLVVAAALGLLGPAAMIEDEKPAAKTDPCAQCDCGAMAMADCDDLALSSLDDSPSAEDFARVEAEWHAAVLSLPEDLQVG